MKAVLGVREEPVSAESAAPAQGRRAGVRRAVRKNVLALADQAVVSGTSFATSLIIGRLCSQEDLGVYSLALSLVLFLRGVQGELVCSPYVVYCHRREGAERAQYTGSTLVHYLLLTAASVFALAGLFAVGAGPAQLGRVAWALVGAVPFLLLREYVRQVSFGNLRVGMALAIDGVVAVLQIGGLLLLHRLGLLTVGAAYAVAGSACALACLGWGAAGWRQLRFGWSALTADWRHNWTFARWTLASFLVGNTAALLGPWVVALSHGQADTGVLAACQSLVNCANIYVIGMSNLLAPRAAEAFARGGADELRRVLRHTVLLFAATLGLFCLVVIALGDLPTTLVYGPQYAGHRAVLGLLSVQVLVVSMGITAGTGLWALERPEANLAADACAFGVTTLALFALVPPLGVLGAPLATLAGVSTGTAVRWLRLARLLQGARCAAETV